MDPSVPYYDCSIMQGSTVPENAADQLSAYHAVQDDAMQQIFIERLFSLKNNESPCFLFGQRKNQACQFNEIELIPVILSPKNTSQRAEAIECLANFGLENNDNQDKKR